MFRIFMSSLLIMTVGGADLCDYCNCPSAAEATCLANLNFTRVCSGGPAWSTYLTSLTLTGPTCTITRDLQKLYNEATYFFPQIRRIYTDCCDFVARAQRTYSIFCTLTGEMIPTIYTSTTTPQHTLNSELYITTQMPQNELITQGAAAENIYSGQAQQFQWWYAVFFLALGSAATIGLALTYKFTTAIRRERIIHNIRRLRPQQSQQQVPQHLPPAHEVIELMDFPVNPVHRLRRHPGVVERCQSVPNLIQDEPI